jgi:hypothetical protein
MLPDRSRRIRASGWVELVNRADSPVTWLVAERDPGKKQVNKLKHHTEQMMAIDFFMGTSLIYLDMVDISMGP